MIRFGHVEFEVPNRQPKTNVKIGEFINLEARGLKGDI